MFQILVVEDDKDLNRTVCAFLNASGYRATDCLSAGEAYDAMYDEVFDLIVSDIMMPGIDGFEFAKTVRSLNENIPILFMTERDDFASKQRGYRIGVDDYMVKPRDLHGFERIFSSAGSFSPLKYIRYSFSLKTSCKQKSSIQNCKALQSERFFCKTR